MQNDGGGWCAGGIFVGVRKFLIREAVACGTGKIRGSASMR